MDSFPRLSSLPIQPTRIIPPPPVPVRSNTFASTSNGADSAAYSAAALSRSLSSHLPSSTPFSVLPAPAPAPAVGSALGSGSVSVSASASAASEASRSRLHFPPSSHFDPSTPPHPPYSFPIKQTSVSLASPPALVSPASHSFSPLPASPSHSTGSPSDGSASSSSSSSSSIVAASFANSNTSKAAATAILAAAAGVAGSAGVVGVRRGSTAGSGSAQVYPFPSPDGTPRMTSSSSSYPSSALPTAPLAINSQSQGSLPVSVFSPSPSPLGNSLKCEGDSINVGVGVDVDAEVERTLDVGLGSHDYFVKKLEREMAKTDAGWRAHYIDYTKARTILKKIVFYQTLQTTQGSNTNAIRQAQEREAKYHELFLLNVKYDLEKVNCLFVLKEKVCLDTLEQLNLDAPSNYPQSTVHPDATAVFQRVLCSMMPELVPVILDETVESLIERSSSFQWRGDPSIELELISLYRNFFQVCELVDHLRRFVFINYVVMWKVIQSYNKHCARKRIADSTLLHQLVQQPFYSATRIGKLVQRTHSIATRHAAISSKLLNSTTAAAAAAVVASPGGIGTVQCLLCSDVLDAPVVLPCSHKFCFGCLAQNSQFGTACPACTQPQDCDQHQLHMDSVLSKLIEWTIQEQNKTTNSNKLIGTGNSNPYENGNGIGNFTLHGLNHSSVLDRRQSDASVSISPSPSSASANSNLMSSSISCDGFNSSPDVLSINSFAANLDVLSPSPSPSPSPSHPLSVSASISPSTSASTPSTSSFPSISSSSTCSRSSSSASTSTPLPNSPLMVSSSLPSFCAPGSAHIQIPIPISIPVPSGCANDSAANSAAFSEFFAANYKPKRGQGVSCHQCKTNKEPHLLLFCGNKQEKGVRKRRCRKKYCEQCLRRSYTLEVLLRKDGLDWHCPSCLGACSCAACQREVEMAQANGTFKPPNLGEQSQTQPLPSNASAVAIHKQKNGHARRHERGKQKAKQAGKEKRRNGNVKNEQSRDCDYDSFTTNHKKPQSSSSFSSSSSSSHHSISSKSGSESSSEAEAEEEDGSCRDDEMDRGRESSHEAFSSHDSDSSSSQSSNRGRRRGRGQPSRSRSRNRKSKKNKTQKIKQEKRRRSRSPVPVNLESENNPSSDATGCESSAMPNGFRSEKGSGLWEENGSRPSSVASNGGKHEKFSPSPDLQLDVEAEVARSSSPSHSYSLSHSNSLSSSSSSPSSPSPSPAATSSTAAQLEFGRAATDPAHPVLVVVPDSDLDHPAAFCPLPSSSASASSCSISRVNEALENSWEDSPRGMKTRRLNGQVQIYMTTQAFINGRAAGNGNGNGTANANSNASGVIGASSGPVLGPSASATVGAGAGAVVSHSRGTESPFVLDSPDLSPLSTAPHSPYQASPGVSPAVVHRRLMKPNSSSNSTPMAYRSISDRLTHHVHGHGHSRSKHSISNSRSSFSRTNSIANLAGFDQQNSNSNLKSTTGSDLANSEISNVDDKYNPSVDFTSAPYTSQIQSQSHSHSRSQCDSPIYRSIRKASSLSSPQHAVSNFSRNNHEERDRDQAQHQTNPTKSNGSMMGIEMSLDINSAIMSKVVTHSQCNPNPCRYDNHTDTTRSPISGSPDSNQCQTPTDIHSDDSQNSPGNENESEELEKDPRSLNHALLGRSTDASVLDPINTFDSLSRAISQNTQTDLITNFHFNINGKKTEEDDPQRFFS